MKNAILCAFLVKNAILNAFFGIYWNRWFLASSNPVIGVIKKATRKLVMFPHVDMSKEEWVDELKRVARIVAKKANIVVSAEQLDKIAANDLYIVDTRKFLRAVEEQIKMDALKS